jgi:ribosomal protein S1
VSGRVELEDMSEGMELEGIIRSVKPYGAFVDVGLLLHPPFLT